MSNEAISEQTAEDFLKRLYTIAHHSRIDEAAWLYDMLLGHIEARALECLKMRGLLLFCQARFKAEIGNNAQPTNPVFAELIALINDCLPSVPQWKIIMTSADQPGYVAAPYVTADAAATFSIGTGCAPDDFTAAEALPGGAHHD